MKSLYLLPFAFLILMACAAGKDGKSACGMPKLPGAQSCQGLYNGQVDPPDHEWRIYAKKRQLYERGGLGGGVDGGMYLQGAFEFKTDATCKITQGTIILHGHRINLTGDVKAGKMALLFDGGYGKGTVINGVIKGSVHEGGGRDWVKGIMVGKFAADK